MSCIEGGFGCVEGGGGLRGDWVVLDVDCGWFSSNLWFLHGHSHLAPIGGVFLFEFIYLFIFMFCNGFCGLCDGGLRFWWCCAAILGFTVVVSCGYMVWNMKTL